MNLQERSDLVLEFARVLFANGQSTEKTLTAAGAVAGSLGLRAELLPRWGILQLTAWDKSDESEKLASVIEASPAGVDMDRVAAAMRAAQAVAEGSLAPGAAKKALHAIAVAPPAPTWLFVLAAGAGAAALAVIFGVEHLTAVELIFLSAAGGALLRRWIAGRSQNAFVQPFIASLLAGVIGGIAVRMQLSSSLRLVAVCPCMVLVPGPAVLNGALDLVKGRIHLGAARLIFAAMLIAAISAGLLLGLALLGVSLPVDQAGREVPLWFDVIAAVIAVAAYGIFFSMPAQMFAWPVCVGMTAHALRWWTITRWGASAEAGAFVACLVVGLIETPVSRRLHMPFAAIGFASVVSMIPGVYLFRMASGLEQIGRGVDVSQPLINGTISDGITALVIVLAMSFGLIFPKLVVDGIEDKLSAQEE